MTKPTYFQGLLACLLCILCECGDMHVAGGNSSETQNTLSGVLVDTLGRPRVGDTVFVRPSRWTSEDDPPPGQPMLNVWKTVTDSGGRWMLSGMGSGSWTIEGRSGHLGRMCAQVELGNGNSRIDLPADTMYPHRRLFGRIDGSLPNTGYGRVYVYGTSLHTSADEMGWFVLDDVPVGSLRIAALFKNTAGEQFRSEAQYILSPHGNLGPVVLTSSSFEGEDYRGWPHRHAAQLRYSGVGGFSLESNIDTFPILVRLKGEPVSSLDPTGSSLRFSDQDGKHLHYEIERWDPVLHEADVWLLVYTNRKRSDNYGIVVYWGLPGAADWSDGTAVFDTARGWVGVWHFSGGDPLRDVTGNRLRLSGSGWERVSGIAGDGIKIGPNSRLTAPGALASMGGWSMASAWVQMTSTGNVGNVLRLASQLNDTIAWSLRLGQQSGLRRGAFKTRMQAAADFPAKTSIVLPSDGWMHFGGILEAVRDRPRIRFVLDSTMAYEELFDSVAIAPTDRLLEIGGGWSGVLDEVRVRRWTLHSDAMSLEWGTGRPEATVVWWGQ